MNRKLLTGSNQPRQNAPGVIHRGAFTESRLPKVISQETCNCGFY